MDKYLYIVKIVVCLLTVLVAVTRLISHKYGPKSCLFTLFLSLLLVNLVGTITYIICCAIFKKVVDNTRIKKKVHKADKVVISIPEQSKEEFLKTAGLLTR